MVPAFELCGVVTGFIAVMVLFGLLGALVTLPIGGSCILCGTAIIRSHGRRPTAIDGMEGLEDCVRVIEDINLKTGRDDESKRRRGK